MLPLDPDEHEGGEMSGDEGGHYILCACGEKLEAAPHTFGDWSVEKEAKPGVEGLRSHDCTVCGYVESEKIEALPGVHIHSFDLISHNELYHWLVCECGETAEKHTHTSILKTRKSFI